MSPKIRKTAAFLVALAALIATTAGCPKQPAAKPVESRPAGEPGTSPTTTPLTEKPAAASSSPSQPPATLPESTYDSSPPYPVKLYVRDPDQKQPGWLTVMALSNPGQLATVTGTFPEKNHIHVRTTNVQELRIQIGLLPLAARKPIALHIDEQGLELSSKPREFVTLRRSPAGLWKPVKSDD